MNTKFSTASAAARQARLTSPHTAQSFSINTNGGDCLIVKVDTNGRPVDDPARTAPETSSPALSTQAEITPSAQPRRGILSRLFGKSISRALEVGDLPTTVLSTDGAAHCRPRDFDDSASLTGADNVQGAVEYICTVPTMYHGVVTLPAITDNGDGSVNLGAGVLPHVDADGDGVCVRLPIPATAPCCCLICR